MLFFTDHHFIQLSTYPSNPNRTCKTTKHKQICPIFTYHTHFSPTPCKHLHTANLQKHQTNLVARERILVKSPSRDRSVEGIGTVILVPTGEPLSSIRTMLFVSNLGTPGFCFCLTPTTYACFFCPLMATSTRSPRWATDCLL